MEYVVTPFHPNKELTHLPTTVRLTPNTICMFVFLEQLRKGIDVLREPKKVSEAVAE